MEGTVWLCWEIRGVVISQSLLVFWWKVVSQGKALCVFDLGTMSSGGHLGCQPAPTEDSQSFVVRAEKGFLIGNMLRFVVTRYGTCSQIKLVTRCKIYNQIKTV